ncbi:GNAT family N-acetyltransferase [Nonomuraea spiralis]|uniref:GNAT family N-acetyltransferase n=1 Tax=Nonomuraea spiralis TaxID=46182 RepID=A0ABV5IWQ1_9ACTN|nr:GNAT family protein [Nonomuraea spiralis]
MTSVWVGERVRLRAIEPEDWEAFLGFEEDSDAVRNGWRLHPPRSAAEAKKWATELAEQESDMDQVRLVVAAADDGRPVGMINTHDVERMHGTFAYGISIGTPHHRKGYAGEAIVLLLRYMFAERRFQKAEAWVYSSNEPSLALHRRLGFVEEGRRRRSRFAAGRYDDEVLFGMTVEEFTALYA